MASSSGCNPPVNSVEVRLLLPALPLELERIEREIVALEVAGSNPVRGPSLPLKGLVMEIRFYRTRGPHGYMSNFSPHGFTDESGNYWPTSEHYYQAAKFLGHDDLIEQVRLAKSPMAAASLGRRLSPLREDWEDVKDDVMRRALFLKFTQNLDIQMNLLETGDDTLIEDSPTDFYWGCGASNNGKNMLGKLLMELRDDLRIAHGRSD